MFCNFACAEDFNVITMNSKEISIPVSWGVISGKTWGDCNGMPVLMVHGVQDNCGTFDSLIPLLPQKGFYYICFDMPGHGRSSNYPSHMCYTIMNYVENIRLIIVEYLKLEKFYYIGHSMGGHIGLIFAAAFPEKVMKLIILDTMVTRIVPARFITFRVRERLNDMVKLEQHLTDRIPTYSYEEALNRIRKGRMNFISESAAKLLANRSLVETNNRFSFSTDQRLRINMTTEFSFPQYKSFVDNIECPIIALMAKDSVKAYRDLFQTNHVRLFRDKKIGEFFIEGDHDVHLSHPERVAPIISKFLLLETKSKL